jgi:hypothetical protein
MTELKTLLDALSISDETATALIARYDEPTLLRHALQTLWQMSQGRVTNPAGWFVASLRGNFTPPIGFPSELQTHTITFALDATTFAEIEQCATQHPDRVMQARAKILIDRLKGVPQWKTQ